MSRSVDFLSRASTSSSSGGPSRLPPNSSILITDSVQSPAVFLLTLLIARALRKQTPPPGGDIKGKGKAKVVLVGVSEVESEYTNILKKQSVQLGTEKSLGRFEFIDAASADLAATYAAVVESLSRDAAGSGSLVVVDDLTALSWSGHDLTKIVKFHLALQTLVLSTRSTLVTVVHADQVSPHPVVRDESDQYLFRKVLASSDYWFELKSLVAQARGELSIHPGPALSPSSASRVEDPDDERLQTRVGKDALEYRLEENGAVFEVKGLGRFI
ncbi:hypothetical protein JCM11491_006278 [Sporobolomyces phaffii]